MASVAVVGAGIIGVTTALAILEKDPFINLTVVADAFTPHTTSDGAAGLIMPYTMSNTPMTLQRKWFGFTLRKLQILLHTEKAPELGIFLMSGLGIHDKVVEMPEWKDLVYSFKKMTNEELSDFPLQPAKCGFSFTTIMAQGSYLIPWLMEKIKQLGGKFVKRKISSLAELSDFDVIVNCTGIFARELVGDILVQPIRGQIMRVKAPWIKHFYFYVSEELNKDGRGIYVIPQMESVVIGGTLQLNDFNDKPTLEDTVRIVSGVSQIIPSLKNAPILSNWAGLRPGRCTVRLERESMECTDGLGRLKMLNVVHNYGHGGAGLSCSFGCAEDCRDLVFEALATKMIAKL